MTYHKKRYIIKASRRRFVRQSVVRLKYERKGERDMTMTTTMMCSRMNMPMGMCMCTFSREFHMATLG